VCYFLRCRPTCLTLLGAYQHRVQAPKLRAAGQSTGPVATRSTCTVCSTSSTLLEPTSLSTRATCTRSGKARPENLRQLRGLNVELMMAANLTGGTLPTEADKLVEYLLPKGRTAQDHLGVSQKLLDLLVSCCQASLADCPMLR
jgi:hypothetical protein